MKNKAEIIKYLKVARTHYENVIAYNRNYSKTLTEMCIKDIENINKLLGDLER